MPAFTSYLAVAALAGGAMYARKQQKKAEKAIENVPPPAPPAPPIGVPETGKADVTRKRKMIKSGRGGTILTGDLAPQNTGKARLLSGKV